MKQRVDAANKGSGIPSGIDEHDKQNANPGKRKRADLVHDDDGDARLQEYLEVMQPPSKSKIWANEDSLKTKIGTGQVSTSSTQLLGVSQQAKEYEHVPKKIKSFPIVQEVDESLHPNSASTTTTNDFTNPSPLVKETHLPQSTAPPPSDEDWQRSRTSRLLGLIEAEDAPDVVAPLKRNEEKLAAERPSIPQKLLEENVSLQNQEVEGRTSVDPMNDTRPASGRLFVRNLSYTATEEEIKMHFESNARVSIVEVRLSISSEPFFFLIW